MSKASPGCPHWAEGGCRGLPATGEGAKEAMCARTLWLEARPSANLPQPGAGEPCSLPGRAQRNLGRSRAAAPSSPGQGLH